MEKKISVIIPQNEEHTYLIRCLNSICRQTYQNVEIVLTGADYPKELTEKYPTVLKMEYPDDTKENWRRILEKLEGDYIYFCSETSVLAPNVLADLLVHADDSEAYMTAQCMLSEGADFSNCVKAEASVYGKMLKKEILLEFLGTKEIDGIYALEWAVLEYLNRFQRLECDEQVFVYETNRQVFETHPPVVLEEEAQKKWLEKIKVYSAETQNAFIESWISAAMQEEQTEQAFSIAISVAKIFSDKEMNYEIARKYVSGWYLDSLEQEKYLYQWVLNYLECFEYQEEYLRVILGACGIEREQYELMKHCTLEDYLFFKDKPKEKIEEEKIFEKQLDELENHLREELESSRGKIEQLLQQNMEVIAAREVRGENTVAAVKNYETELEGPVLAEYVIAKYQQGGLGLKTILKSFAAWVKYKF